MAISGFGGGNCQMAAFALSELLPNKWRHIGVIIADITTIMAVIIGPASGRLGIEHGNWQWNFWAAAIAQFLSFLGLLFLYFPPAHPYGIPIHQMVKEIDYVGGILFIVGAVPLLIGIVYTTIFPSNNAHVVAPLVIGFFFIICFACWERFAKLKHPLTPTYVFTSSHGRDFTAPAIALGVVNMFYYSSSILWPTMINTFYTDGGADWRYGIALSLPQGFAILTGAGSLAIFGRSIRNWQWQLTGSVFFMVFFGSLLALATQHNKSLMIAFVFLSQTGYGWAIYLAIAVSQMGVEHKDLGISGGISGVVRFAAGSIAAAVYTTILTNTTNTWIMKLVPSAAVAAGLPESQIAALMKVVGTSALAKEFGTKVAAAVANAVAEATVHGIRIVAFTSLAFGVVGIIASACCKDVDAKMNNKIEVYLENTEMASRNRNH
ncbi:fungal trichothecene efflux pump [Exophiala viscosa]|uniref:Fungal trichothecene efflux pump n=2 Tax=Exophiala viscosa TaxID=2486360 RepID=A0AAN6DXV5_9EURO|nr:fungal trichothecene efflux pump [Exophiala viscosa]